MFENRSERELIIIYAVIALAVALGLSVMHYYQGWHPYVIVIVANVWFFCLFYFMYLPNKVKRASEKEKKKK